MSSLLSYTSLLDGDSAYLALFSTFQFDPVYFERKLLSCPALTKARRIAIFMDYRQWLLLSKQEIRSRLMNSRYLVVPVKRNGGVFHPKLNLILTETGGQVQCGSNNLTRSGCSNNLELLNSLPFEVKDDFELELQVARESLRFFELACQNTEDEYKRILNEWLADLLRIMPWLRYQERDNADSEIKLVHTYDGSLWDHLNFPENDATQTKFLIASPFHDRDGKIIEKIRLHFPNSKIEFVVQQGYTNLPTDKLRALSGILLSEISEPSRRAHSKLIAWSTDGGSCFLVGSANFTSAAFDGRNVEASLMIRSDESLDCVFKGPISKRKISIDDFEPGVNEEPLDNEYEPPKLFISSAVLLDKQKLQVSYGHHLGELPTALWLTMRTSQEARSPDRVRLSIQANGSETVYLSDAILADAHGSLLATLVAETDSGRVESTPTWVIVENKLTYEPSGGSSSSSKKIEQSGEGLTEYLEELGKREGVLAVQQYLQRMNIRFYDGAGSIGIARKFRVQVTDPFNADEIPDWLTGNDQERENLELAIYEFSDRHEKKKLRKHGENGNVNGIENFLDIMTALVRLLYVYYRRGTVQRLKLVGRLNRYLQIATLGKDTEKEFFNGFLYSIYDRLGGDVESFQEYCDETGLLSEIRGILLIVQTVRFVEGENNPYGPNPIRPKDVLQAQSKMVATAIGECWLEEPSRHDVENALRRYRMFTDNEIELLLDEM